ncbi:endospore germination permease [Paenibacillus sp. OV219]|uniref:GerAB/ArcD/ProY family transporter n=1 Tax=Paenibacillus sp. OV219 TaxID=1884377 RepID=UPI0008D138CE|nr:endospore germination permease [Paenibacillus sp. OV219]SEN14805.1 spore germination protein KB [Paenibacillus sp. OV219]
MKISGYQLFWLVYTLDYGKTAIFTISPAILAAKQDAWLSIIAASLIGLVTTYIAVKVSLLHPKQTFIQYTQTILGKWLGTVILIPIFLMWIAITGLILREFADFVFIALFSKTPLWTISLIMLAAVVYITSTGGLTSIGRCSEIIGPISIIGSLLIILLSVKDWNLFNLLPVYANTGLLPIMKGSLFPASFIAESFMIVMLIAFLPKPERAMAASILGVTAASISILFITFIVILVFGPHLAGHFVYPIYSVVTYISVMEFIQNIDVIIVLLWIIGIFIKLALYFFVTSYGTAQLLRFPKWKKSIWLITPIVFAISLIPRNIDDTIDFANFWRDVIFPVNLVGIPILLWIVGSIRKKYRANAKTV